PTCRRVAVIGAGFIGLELHRLSKEVHLMEKGLAVLPQADADVSHMLHSVFLEHVVHLQLGESLRRALSTTTGLTVQTEAGKEVEMDLALLCVEMSPDSMLTRDAGLALGTRGHTLINGTCRPPTPPATP
ncbi:hypothetical protein EON64_10615, partial [archaeon]